jgi:hypothetical protein
VEVLLWCLLVAAIIALFFGRSRRVAVVAIAVVLILLVVRAETPFGFGNGTVPDLVGFDECTATEKLEARELRWRFGPHSPIGGRPASCVDTGGGIGSVADAIVGQRPTPGGPLAEAGPKPVAQRGTRSPLSSTRRPFDSRRRIGSAPRKDDPRQPVSVARGTSEGKRWLRRASLAPRNGPAYEL